MVTEFVHVINDFQVLQPIPEKKRDIIALGEMIKIAKGNIGIALPQVSFSHPHGYQVSCVLTCSSDLCLLARCVRHR